MFWDKFKKPKNLPTWKIPWACKMAAGVTKTMGTAASAASAWAGRPVTKMRLCLTLTSLHCASKPIAAMEALQHGEAASRHIPHANPLCKCLL